ncbi:hypothetical protein AVEN_225032-1, partial [Araneus ventricosus]
MDQETDEWYRKFFKGFTGLVGIQM